MGIIFLTAVTLLFSWRTLWEIATTRKEHFESKDWSRPIRGWKSVRRFSESPVSHGRSVTHYLENGFLAWEQIWDDGVLMRHTEWQFDGTLHYQSGRESGVQPFAITENHGPVWWWGLTHQSVPTAPWWPLDPDPRGPEDPGNLPRDPEPKAPPPR